MKLTLTEEQAMMRDTVRRFLGDRFDAVTMAKEPMSREDWLALGELGLFAFLLPERAGGMGAGPVEVMLVSEELGRSMAITPLANSVLHCAALVADHGTQAQIERWVEPVARGEQVMAYAIGGTVRDGRLNGDAGLVRDGMEAAAFVVAAENGVMALVAADGPGVIRSAIRLIDGSMAAALRFEDAACDVIGTDPRQIAEAGYLAELSIVAEMVGAMGALLDLTVEYVGQRKQFGAPIGSFQAIQHRCARLFVLLEQSRSMLLRAALAEPDLRGEALRAAQAYVATAALRLAEDAVQLHGGMGVTEELAVGRGLRRVLLLSRLSDVASRSGHKLAA
ncbi:acyl-CoA dehydrogenase family protein [Novosphingobium resinovorum]|uniref:Acyl-CoA dehydrogenase n=1 Tax=Novosphingobium resinovorum TaxID=158500 RepID=A0A1D8ADS9_9SPHN|nr:acyl-CoA dehydrogenase family protein [Novosphingobium resinovorum]AOR80215.1 acyl-CoA dehydrogenase [Novosphingobium resinovorum]